jgi:hypothetical protein
MTKQARLEREEVWKDTGELSLTEIHRQSREYWQRIFGNHKELISVSRSFQRQKILEPDQCSSIRKAISDLHHSTKVLHRFLDKSRLFPLHICSARSSLFNALYRVDIQLEELSILLKMYSAANGASLREMILLSQDIRKKLSEVQSSWKSMERGIQIFWERIQVSDPEISIEMEEDQKIIDFQSRTKRSQASQTHSALY